MSHGCSSESAKKLFLLIYLLIAGAFHLPAEAGEPPVQPPSYSYLEDTYDFHTGIFSQQLNTQIAVTRDPSLPGTLIDFESIFGLPDRQNRPWFEFNWRPGTYSTLRFIYFDTERSGTRSISKDIRFGEVTFIAPSTVSAFNSARYYWLSYQYLFLRNVFNEFGISPGVMVADIKSRLSLQAAGVNGGTDPGSERNKEVSFIAPIPLLGLYLSSQFMPRLFLKNTVRVMVVSWGGYAANLFNYSINFEYNPFKNWGIGTGYSFSRLEITKGFINFNGTFTSESKGGLLYLKYFFS